MNLATPHAAAMDNLLTEVFLVDMEKPVELEGPLPGNWPDYLVELLADSIQVVARMEHSGIRAGCYP